MKPFRKTASVLLAAILLFGLAGNLEARAASPKAVTPLMEMVNDLLGIRYKYAGTTTKGFDCSGFTSYVFEHLFGVNLNRSSKDQATQGVKVAKDKLREGDLVFFKTNGKSISHVGIYIGNNQFAHASTSKGITITSMDDKYYKKRYVTARRILTDDQYLEFASQSEADRRQAESLAAEAQAKAAKAETAAPVVAAEGDAESAEAGEPVSGPNNPGGQEDPEPANI